MNYALMIFSLLFMSCSKDAGRLKEISLTAGSREEKLLVEIADEPYEQSEGLMNRKTLPQGRGMLFIFDRPKRVSFWMKNTLMPLDIIFFDENGEYAGMRTMKPCRHDPCANYKSNAKIKYALEVNAGFERKEWRLKLQDGID